MERLRSRAERYAPVLLGLIAVVAALVRLPFVSAQGYAVDVRYFYIWAERMAQRGPGGFYDPAFFSDYPPGFLYVLWGLGGWFDGEQLRVAIKTVPMLADAAIVLLVSIYLVRKGHRLAALVAGGLWAASPAAIFGGAYWGQMDALGALVAMGALLAAGERRWILAGVLCGAAVMVKPQFGLAAGVVIAAALIELVQGRRWRPLVGVVIPAGTAALVLAAPFGYGALDLLDLVRRASETYPFTSLFAFNGWSIVGGMFVDDAPYYAVGAALLALGLVASCLPLWKDRGPWTVLACGAFAVAAFYFLPTRAHERYILPALVYVLPLVALRPRLIAPYVAVTFAVLLTFVFVFISNDFFRLQPSLNAFVVGRPGQILLALLLIGVTVAFGYGLARPPRIVRS